MSSKGAGTAYTTTLTFAHAAPDSKLLAVAECELKALIFDDAATTNFLGLFCCSWYIILLSEGKKINPVFRGKWFRGDAVAIQKKMRSRKNHIVD